MFTALRCPGVVSSTASCSGVSRTRAFKAAGRVPRRAVTFDAAREDGVSAQADVVTTRRSFLGASMVLAGSSLLSASIPYPAFANRLLSPEWEQVTLPVDDKVVLLDIAFTESDPLHGFLLGTRQTLLETFDGGRTWENRVIESAKDEGFNYRFNSISFSGEEGWIVGKPSILLHTTDGGKSWERVPLSAKLPGSPILVTALAGKPGQAEMTTDQGAIYVTDNAAYTWSAAVQETVDATLNRTVSSGISGASFYEGFFSNIARSPSGEYVAVSSRGNFYMTWGPGQTYWMPHNRPSARRVQNMGWTPDNKLWLTTRGGDVLISPEAGISERFDESQLSSRGFGVLDIAFKDDQVGFACGGSGSLFRTEDGGQSWKREKATDDVAGNLYDIRFFSSGAGFILGNSGILLRYVNSGVQQA